MVKNELNSPALGWLTEEQSHNELISIFQEIKVLTGAVLYAAGDGLEQQVTILKLFILSYPQFMSLTLMEIRHAFYLNSQGEYDEVYRHYNKELNAEFVGDVLRAYLKYKAGIYKRKGKFIKSIVSPPAPVKVVYLTEQECRVIIQNDYDTYCAGRYDFIYIIKQVYRLLRDYGGIQIYSRENWYRLMGRAMDARRQYGESLLSRKDVHERDAILRVKAIYEQQQAAGWIPQDEYRMIIHTIRKQQYFRFFRVMRYFNIRKIFTEIKF